MPNVVERKRIRTAKDVRGIYVGGNASRGGNVCLAIAGGETHHYIPVPSEVVRALVERLKPSRGEYLEATLDEDYVWLNVRRESA